MSVDVSWAVIDTKYLHPAGGAAAITIITAALVLRHLVIHGNPHEVELEWEEPHLLSLHCSVHQTGGKMNSQPLQSPAAVRTLKFC